MRCAAVEIRGVGYILTFRYRPAAAVIRRVAETDSVGRSRSCRSALDRLAGGRQSGRRRFYWYYWGTNCRRDGRVLRRRQGGCLVH
jgi:hypothetical protein